MIGMGIVSVCSIALSAYLYSKVMESKVTIDTMIRDERAKLEHHDSLEVQRTEKETREFIARASATNENIKYAKDINGKLSLYDSDFNEVEVSYSQLEVIASKEYKTDNLVYSYEKLYKVMGVGEVLDLNEELSNLPSEIMTQEEVANVREDTSTGRALKLVRDLIIEESSFSKNSSVYSNEVPLRAGQKPEVIDPAPGYFSFGFMTDTISELKFKPSEYTKLKSNSDDENLNVLFSEALLETLFGKNISDRESASIIVSDGTTDSGSISFSEKDLRIYISDEGKAFKYTVLPISSTVYYSIKIVYWDEETSSYYLYVPHVHYAIQSDGELNSVILN